MVVCWKMPYKRRHMEVVGKPSWIFQHAMFGGWWNEFVYHLPRGSLDNLGNLRPLHLGSGLPTECSARGKGPEFVAASWRTWDDRQSLGCTGRNASGEDIRCHQTWRVGNFSIYIDFPIENSPLDRFKGFSSHVWWHRSVSDRDIQRPDFNLGGL